MDKRPQRLPILFSNKDIEVRVLSDEPLDSSKYRRLIGTKKWFGEDHVIKAAVYTRTDTTFYVDLYGNAPWAGNPWCHHAKSPKEKYAGWEGSYILSCWFRPDPARQTGVISRKLPPLILYLPYHTSLASQRNEGKGKYNGWVSDSLLMVLPYSTERSGEGRYLPFVVAIDSVSGKHTYWPYETGSSVNQKPDCIMRGRH